MGQLARWTVDIVIDEDDGNTRAHATLRPGSDDPVAGFGLALCHPADRDVPAIGAELAAARALSDLAHQLIEATINDIEIATQRRATVTT